MVKDYDFCGWATRNDVRCSDGRTIRHNAFVGNNGQTVPLVWNHDHDNPYNVLGHALLENRNEGVFAYCKFNDNEAAKNAKELVRHGDVSSLSIYANQLKQNGGDVIHGNIREVSLVLAGANPEAYIESVMYHSENANEEAVIFTGEPISLYHSEDKKHEDEKENKEPAEEIKNNEEDNKMPENKEKTVKDVFDELTEEQKTVVYALIGQVLEDAKKNNNSDSEEDDKMKHNVFENESGENVLSHSEMNAIFADGRRSGSLKEAVLQHGIDDIEVLFPDASTMNGTPEFIKRETDWVTKVMNGTHHSPFSRIKSVFADITEDEARAKGYLADRTHRDKYGNLVDSKGNPAYKKEEVFSLLKRTTTPTTIYKKQKLDRDDVIDITDFDVVSWIKSEMRLMLDEEIARAILVGDGRLNSDDDKISELNIRPIWKDDDLYTIKTYVEYASTDDDSKKAKEFIRSAIKARKSYKGTGNPVCFITEDLLTECLLLEDAIGHRIYKTEQDVATAIRAKEIVTVPVMENLTREVNGKNHELAAIFVNLADYNVGADKGGSVSMFDDFDIDYNAQKYLIETRCSGALTKPYSAYVIEFVPATVVSGGGEPENP